MQKNILLKAVINELDDCKAINICSLDVRSLTSVTDHMVIVTGNSRRHVLSIAQNLIRTMKDRQIQPLGMECDLGCEWALVDLGDIVVHIMQQQTRDFYQLEKLWSAPEIKQASA